VPRRSEEQALVQALVQALDDRMIWFMHFMKKQILAESIDDEAITPPQFGLLYCLFSQRADNHEFF
jgi:hypothetical protein